MHRWITHFRTVTASMRWFPQWNSTNHGGRCTRLVLKFMFIWCNVPCVHKPFATVAQCTNNHSSHVYHNKRSAVALRGAPVPQSVSSEPCEGFTNDGSPIYCKQLRQDPNAKHTHWTLIKMTLWTSSLTIECSNVTFKCILGSYTSALDCNLKRTMFNKTSSLGLLICIVSFRFDTLHFAKMSQMTSFEAVMSWLHPS